MHELGEGCGPARVGSSHWMGMGEVGLKVKVGKQ